MHDPLRPQEVNIHSALKTAAPRPAGLRWFILGGALIVAAKLLFFNGFNIQDPIVENSSFYTVPYDPDLKRLEKKAAADHSARAAVADNRETNEKTVRAPESLPPPLPGQFRVAAAQIHSYFGRKSVNRRRMAAYVAAAGRLQAKFIVFPEAALNGYGDLNDWHFWASDPEKANLAAAEQPGSYSAVEKTAETIDGESVKFFQHLAGEHNLYIALPFIEKELSAGRYYNSLILIAPDGKILIHYRKCRLQEMLDSQWATAAPPCAPLTAATPYGHVGLLIGADLHVALPLLKAEKAEIILHSAGFAAVNLDRWLNQQYQKNLEKHRMAAVLANWAMRYTAEWDGYGLSRIISRDNRKIAALGTQPEERLLVGDLPLPAASTTSSTNIMQGKQ